MITTLKYSCITQARKDKLIKFDELTITRCLMRAKEKTNPPKKTQKVRHEEKAKIQFGK